MKIPKFINCIGCVDGDLIADAADSKTSKKVNYRVVWTIAAALVLCTALTALILPMALGEKDFHNDRVMEDETDMTHEVINGMKVIHGFDRDYKEVVGNETATEVIWPWEYRPSDEKYRIVVINGEQYNTRWCSIDEGSVGNKIGDYEAEDVDGPYGEEPHKDILAVYEIKRITPDYFVAIMIDGQYYVYSKRMEIENAPETLGELMSLFNLQENLTLNRFSDMQKYDSQGYYSLSDDDYIWEVLTDCSEVRFEAKYSGNDLESITKNRYLSFTVTIDKMGVYKKAMYITEDGRLWTNLFFGACYDIGKEAAAKIINYALENGKSAEELPYEHFVTGYVTAIEDDYVLIDDTELCKDPDDGMTFKISIEDMKIKRYFEYLNAVEVGDLVVFIFRDPIWQGEDGTLYGANRLEYDVYIFDDGNVGWLE